MQGFRDFFNRPDGKGMNEADVVYLYTNGASWDEIARQTGRSKGDIQRILEKNHIGRNRLKQKHGLVNYLREAGHTPKDIAAMVGMTPQGINYIFRRHR